MVPGPQTSSRSLVIMTVQTSQRVSSDAGEVRGSRHCIFLYLAWPLFPSSLHHPTSKVAAWAPAFRTTLQPVGRPKAEKTPLLSKEVSCSGHSLLHPTVQGHHHGGFLSYKGGWKIISDRIRPTQSPSAGRQKGGCQLEERRRGVPLALGPRTMSGAERMCFYVE